MASILDWFNLWHGVTGVASSGVFLRGDGVWASGISSQGQFIAQAFSSANFFASGSMTWSVDGPDVATDAFLVEGKHITYAAYIGTTTVGGTPANQLRRALPNGWAAVRSYLQPMHYLDNGTRNTGFMQITTSSTHIEFHKADNGNWDSSSVNNTGVFGVLTFEIV